MIHIDAATHTRLVRLLVEVEQSLLVLADRERLQRDAMHAIGHVLMESYYQRSADGAARQARAAHQAADALRTLKTEQTTRRPSTSRSVPTEARQAPLRAVQTMPTHRAAAS